VVISTASDDVTHPLQARQSAIDMVAFFLVIGLFLLSLIVGVGGSGRDDDSGDEGSIVLLRAIVLDAS